MTSRETETVIDLTYSITFITQTTRLDWKSLKCSCPSTPFIWPKVGRISGVTLYNNGLLSFRPLHLDRLKYQHLYHPLEHLNRHSSKWQLQKKRFSWEEKVLRGQWCTSITHVCTVYILLRLAYRHQNNDCQMLLKYKKKPETKVSHAKA